MTDDECRCKVCTRIANLETELAAAHQEVADLRRTVARDIDAHRLSGDHDDACLCPRCCALTAAAGVAEWGARLPVRPLLRPHRRRRGRRVGAPVSARDDAIEAGAAVLVGGTNYIMSGDAGVAGTMNRLTATFVVDAVEPIIRADERERMADLARKVQGGGIRDYEAEVRERIAQEVRDMNPWMVLGYSNHPDEKLAGRVIAEVAARIARGGAQ